MTVLYLQFQKNRGYDIVSSYMTANKVLFYIWHLVVWAPIENLCALLVEIVLWNMSDLS